MAPLRRNLMPFLAGNRAALLASFGLALAVGQQSASAQVVFYDQSLNLNGDGGPYSYFSQQIADRFSVSQDVTLSGAIWYGDDFNAVAPTFEIRVFADVDGLPASTHIVQQTVTPTVVDTGLSTGGSQIFQFTATLPTPVALTGGNVYWFSVLENPFSNFRWANGTTLDLGDLDNALRGSDLSAWSQIPGNRAQAAFTLLAIPEPGTWVLLAIGTAALALKFRRRV